MDLFTITAIDRDTSDTTSRTFSTKSLEIFQSSVKEWEKELPYRKYELISEELIEDYSDGVVDILDELEIIY